MKFLIFLRVFPKLKTEKHNLILPNTYEAAACQGREGPLAEDSMQ